MCAAKDGARRPDATRLAFTCNPPNAPCRKEIVKTYIGSTMGSQAGQFDAMMGSLEGRSL